MVIDSSNVKDSRILLDRTPKNYNSNNYYLKELQDKINADWRFRPNRFDIEEEQNFGEEIYTPIEVVLQSVKSEKGETLSDDWKKVVFKDLDKKIRIGTRYRFASEFGENYFNPKVPDYTKNIWLAVNQNRIKQTASQTIVRCNGTLGSIYKDEEGRLSYHYEPVVQSDKLQGTSFGFNIIAIDPRGSITAIVQFNKYTEQYYINQRFVIGYDQVFKVQNISKTSSMTTYDPKDLGVIILYMQMDQVGDLDDLENRIAYNGREGENVPEVPDTPITKSIEIKIEDPLPLPQFLYDEPIEFSVYSYIDGEKVEKDIQVELSIDGIQDLDKYVYFNLIDTNHFVLRRKRFYGGEDLKIKCFVSEEDMEDSYFIFAIGLGGLE